MEGCASPRRHRDRMMVPDLDKVARMPRAVVIASGLLVVTGLLTAFSSIAQIATFDNRETTESVVYMPGLIIAALGGLAVLYAFKGSKALLWATVVLSLLYSALIVFGAGPLPLMAAMVLLVTTAVATVARRSQAIDRIIN